MAQRFFRAGGRSPRNVISPLKSTPTTADSTLAPIRDDVLKALRKRGAVGAYHTRGERAAEPTSWATIALASAGFEQEARIGAEWLVRLQPRDGSVAVTSSQDGPNWPTSLAILAWNAVDPVTYHDCIHRAAHWTLDQTPWTKSRDRIFGHDTTLEGWSWAPHTHSWIEPTAFCVAALRRSSYTTHKRYQQAVRLLVDRLLPRGGVNYGNTIVLGQELLQHIQPTGIVAWALAGEEVEDTRWGSLIDYLREAALRPTGAASLAYAVMGLASHGVDTTPYHMAIADAWRRAKQWGGVYKPALLLLAIEASLNQSDPVA